MISKVLTQIQTELVGIVNAKQSIEIGNLINAILSKYNLFERTITDNQNDNQSLVMLFISAKQVEGCSPKTLNYYNATIMKMLSTVQKSIVSITTDDLRSYLSEYQIIRSSGKITMDNIRRILSSFFSWLEDEEYIIKSPVRRIHRVKSGRIIKETFTDEELENMRDACDNLRDLAIIDMLTSTGMRVGELVKLNIDDVNLRERECVVLGKGDSERKVYFDARAKIHLQEYLKSRSDDNLSLFVSLNKPHRELKISGVESRLKCLGNRANIKNVYPHKFRRTLATHAIDKGMPIEQVQKLLGHIKIDTTMHYAMVNQSNVKISHRRYIS